MGADTMPKGGRKFLGAIALGVLGVGLGVAGTAMSASSADKKRKSLKNTLNQWLPDIDRYTENYFSDLMRFTPQAGNLADEVGQRDFDRAMRQREQALPGVTEATQGAMGALAPLLKGELPPSVLKAFQSAGGASSVGLGMGGSGFGFLNTGLFGARGAMGAMQTGFGLLPALMSTLPNVNSPGTAAFLESIMTPAQRTNTQLQIRQQNIGITQALAGMPTGKDMWGNFMSETGGAMLGGALGGMGGFGGGGGGGGSKGSSRGATITSPNYVTPL